MYLIVIVHELGHIFIAIIFKYKIKKINIYPFGGYTILEYDINRPFIEELLLFSFGIIFQLLLLLIFNTFIDNNTYIYKIFYSYNLTILLFNLLPIIPLDGSKIFNIIINYVLPFKLSHKLTIYISYITIVILILAFNNDINMIIMCVLLLFLLIKEHKNHVYLYNSFLIERYIKNIKFKKSNFINSNKLYKMKKYLKNIFIIDNKYVDEKDILKMHYK